MTVTKQHVVQWLEHTAAVLNDNKDYLTQLDSPIGDADHGINMSRGFKAVLGKLPSVADKDIGNILKTTGMALISSVGGASGPLYGTFFMRSGAASMSKEELNNEDLLQLFLDGVDGIVQRGRPQLGDKTMFDAWAPALEAMQAACREWQRRRRGLAFDGNGCRTGNEEYDPPTGQKRTSQLSGRAQYWPPGSGRDLFVSDSQGVA